MAGAEQFYNAKSSFSPEKQFGEQSTSKPPQSSVTYVYNTHIAGQLRDVTITWTKNLMNYFLIVNIEKADSESYYACKIDLKTWQFWGKKGLKSIEVDGRNIDVYWDFRQAKFSSYPEPHSDYYIALVDKEEIVLLLGDMKDEAYKRIKKRPSLHEPTFLCKKENVYGKKIFCTKTILIVGKQEHDLIIELGSSGSDDPEMWMSIDGLQVIHVPNLHWRFRGNEEVRMNNVLLHFFWDVYDLVFPGGAIGQGLFILKPSLPERDSNNGKRNKREELTAEMVSENAFLHVIYAWKVEQGKSGL